MRVTVQKVLDTIDEVAGWLPHLTIVTAECRGHAWLVDTTTDTIYVSPRQSPGRWAIAALAALDVLCEHHDVARPGEAPSLRLIPSPRTVQASAMTGTSD